MPPKKAKKVAEEAPPDSIFQAVVLADSFNKRFRPLTLEKPRCLLPLANMPLIEYTFEFLALANVQEVFVFCCAHADQIDEYIHNSKWVLPSSPFQKVKFLPTFSSMSVGDVMRDLDLKNLITTDFLLVSGDIVSNFTLAPVLAEHRMRRAASNNAIMTMLLREASPDHRTRARGETGVFVLDPAGTRCLHYEEIRSQKHGRRTITLDPELLKEHKEVQIRNDLLDCYVDIVSPDVPALFTENFDYNHIRRDFVHGILLDGIYGKNIYCAIVQDEYAARVRSIQTYDAVSRDIMSRWTYPMCPDSNLQDGQTYRYQRGHIYKEEDVVLARSCKIDRRVVIGKGTTIGDGSTIIDSVIGRNCNIGRNSVLKGVYIWDNVSIGDDCVIEKTIMGAGAALGDGCTVAPGAVISFSVVIGKGVNVPGTARISHFARNGEEDYFAHKEGGEIKNDVSAVGVGGEGYEYEDSDDSDEDEKEEIEQSGMVYKTPFEPDASFDSMSELSEDDDDAVSRHLTSSTLTSQRARRPSSSISNNAEDEEERFNRECFSSVLSAFELGHPSNVISLELTSLRMSYNASFAAVRRGVSAAIMARIEELLENKTRKPLLNTPTLAVESLWVDVNPMIKRMVFEEADMVDLLDMMTLASKSGKVLLAVVYKLYNDDSVSEEAVMKWWVKPGEDAEAKERKAACAQFVDWLQQAEEEESDEEESD